MPDANTVENFTFSSFNWSKFDVAKYREELSDRMALTLLPSILTLSFILLIGLCGNILVVFIYYYKFNPSSTRSAILALAFMDLLTCAVCIPGEILDLRFTYNFTDQFLCRAVRFINTIVLVASGFTLVMVSLDRYQRICHPLKEQLTANKAWKRVFLLCSAAVIVAIPAPIVYGLAKIPTPIDGVYGWECSTSQEFEKHPFRIVYFAFLCCVFVAAFTTMLVTYSLIGRQVLRQKNFRNTVHQRKSSGALGEAHRRHTICSDEEVDPSISDGAKGSSLIDAVIPENDLMSCEQESSTKQNVKHVTSSKLTRRPTMLNRIRQFSQSGDARTRKTTLMLFFITMVFVISFLPHVLLKAIQALNKNFVDNISTTGVIVYNIFVRSCFFNTAVNTFVYGFCSQKFRTECKALLLRLAFWVKKRRVSLHSDDVA